MKPVTLSVSDVMNNKALLGPFFAGESWAVWRSVVKAMSAERMSAAEVETFRSVAERDPRLRGAEGLGDAWVSRAACAVAGGERRGR